MNPVISVIGKHEVAGTVLRDARGRCKTAVQEVLIAGAGHRISETYDYDAAGRKTKTLYIDPAAHARTLTMHGV